MDRSEVDRRKVDLVAGAGSGIGAAIAARLAGDGQHVFRNARRTDRARALTERTARAGVRPGAGPDIAEAGSGGSGVRSHPPGWGVSPTRS